MKNKDFLGLPKTRLVTYLSPWQRGEERPLSSPNVYVQYFRKRIVVMHYYEPGVADYYIQILDESKINSASNRIIWYPYNFVSDKKMAKENKKYNQRFMPNKQKPKKTPKRTIDWPKHYTEKEILAIYERKTPENKLKVLEKALKVKGSKVHKLAVAMGYYYTDDYNEATWVKEKSR